MKRSQRTSLTKDELLRVLKTAKEHSARDWALLLVTFRHGLRASEVAELTLDNIQEDQLSVQRVKGSLRTVQPIMKHPGQPLLDEARALTAWRKERAAVYPKDDSKYLFLSREGGSLCREQVFRIFKKHAEAAGLPPEKRFIHIMKHTLASFLVDMDTNLEKVRVMLGHASLSSTQQYLHVNDAQASKAASEALRKMF